jgi:hypothetical protein
VTFLFSKYPDFSNNSRNKNCPAMGGLNWLKFRNVPNFRYLAGFFAGNKKCPKGH